MKKTAIAAVLGVGTVLTAAASDQGTKPSVQTKAGTAAGTTLNIPRPDFRAWAEGPYVVVANFGDADWTGPVDVKATCKKEGTKQTATICGPSFPNGAFFYHLASFPPGRLTAPPIVTSAHQSGPGYRALPTDLPPGSFEIVVTVDPNGKIAEKDETNNQSTKSVTIAPPPGGIGVNPPIPIRK